MKTVLVSMIVAAALISAPLGTHAGDRKPSLDRSPVARDCTPYNGPFGYNGNPWCDGGWKMTRDSAPGTNRVHEAFDTPKADRHTRRE